MSYVFNYGMITASTVYIIDKKFSFPQPNEYAEISEVLDSVGGEAVNTAIMLSKLGINTKLDGNWINSRNKNKIISLLKPFNIDISRLTTREDFGTEEIVLVDTSTRTIFGNFAKFHSGEKQWNTPFEEDIVNCSMVALDPYFCPEAEDIAHICIKHHKPYVTFDCKYDGFMGTNAEAVIISHELRNKDYKECNPKELFISYIEHCKGLIVFTFGSDELWYGRNGGTMNVFKPFNITPVDTTGAGDSFRAGIIYGLIQKWDDYKTIEFASAVAANVCLTRPHTLNAPGLEEILSFIFKYAK